MIYNTNLGNVIVTVSNIVCLGAVAGTTLIEASGYNIFGGPIISVIRFTKHLAVNLDKIKKNMHSKLIIYL